MVIEDGHAMVEPTRMPGVIEPVEIQMMAKLVAQGAQEGAEGCDFFPNSRPRPDSNGFCVRVIIPEKFSR